MPEKKSNGLIIRGANGDLYFLREEILEAAKVTEPEMKKFLETVANEQFRKDPRSFSVKLGAIDKAVPVTGKIVSSKIDMKAMSTIMCPGVMKDKDFVITPPMSKETRF